MLTLGSFAIYFRRQYCFKKIFLRNNIVFESMCKKKHKNNILKIFNQYNFEVVLFSNTCFLRKQVFKSNITSKLYQSKVDDKKLINIFYNCDCKY